MTFKESLIKFTSALEGIKKEGLNPLQQNTSEKQIYDFKTKKDNMQIGLYKTAFEELKRKAVELNDLRKVDEKNEKAILNVNILLNDATIAFQQNNLSKVEQKVEEMKFHFNTLIMPQKTVETIKFNESLPEDIHGEMKADADELHQCFQNNCFRSSIILCGRMLETALHRKYFEVTQNDLLEKSPGIGLGNLISKLKEKEIQLPPGLPNQIHLINQVRISSVHKKQETFNPTKTQTEGLILLTLDTVDQLFSK